MRSLGFAWEFCKPWKTTASEISQAFSMKPKAKTSTSTKSDQSYETVVPPRPSISTAKKQQLLIKTSEENTFYFVFEKQHSFYEIHERLSLRSRVLWTLQIQFYMQYQNSRCRGYLDCSMFLFREIEPVCVLKEKKYFMRFMQYVI